MTMTIELSGELEAALKAHAAAQGISAENYANDLVRHGLLANKLAISNAPRRSGRGILSKYGPGPSEEDIAEVRAEMWRNFPRDID